MKRTLLLTHEYYPYRGGIARYCYELFSRLPLDRFTVLTDQKGSDPAVPVVTRRLLSSFMKPGWLRGIYVVQKALTEFRSEVIFTPHLLPLGTVAEAVHALKGTPYVISLHGLDINLALQNKKKLAENVLSHAVHIIANSESTAATVRQLKLNVPLTVLTPCLSRELLAIDEAARTRIAHHYAGKTMILTVGRLVKRKGQDSVIRALPTVLRKVPTAHYCIVGDGPDRMYLEGLIRELGLSRHVQIRRNVPDRELGAYYEAASVFAMPTRAIGPDVEGFGMVYLEAAYFSKAIIAGRSSGEAEALDGEQNALFVDGENVDQLAHTLRELLLDGELASFLGANARKHVDSLPTWDAQAKILEGILSSV